MRDEVADCLVGMLDGVESALGLDVSSGSAARSTFAAEPAPRWASQPAARQDAGLKRLANGRFAPAAAVIGGSYQRLLPSDHWLAAEAPEKESSAGMGAQAAIGADLETRAAPMVSDRMPDSHARRLDLDAAGARHQRDTASQPVDGDGRPRSCSELDAHCRQQQQQQQQQAVQPRFQHSTPEEPTLQLPPPSFALSSPAGPASISNSGMATVEAPTNAIDVQRCPSAPDKPG